MKREGNESQKTISVKKEHTKSIKTFNKLLTFESKVDKSERYSNNMLTNTRINFKSSRKLNGSRLKKVPSYKAPI